MKLRPRISGCSVRTKTPTRHSGKPACTRRSQVSAITWGGLAADLAPSMSQSVIFCRSSAFMEAFAAQVPERSRRYKRFELHGFGFQTVHRADEPKRNSPPGGFNGGSR